MGVEWNKISNFYINSFVKGNDRQKDINEKIIVQWSHHSDSSFLAYASYYPRRPCGDDDIILSSWTTAKKNIQKK